MSERKLYVGIDVGSTTTKVAALDVGSRELVYADYQRHHAAQIKSVYEALVKLGQTFPEAQLRLVLTGSGSKPLAEALDVPYIQEVVANSIALRADYADVAPPSSWAGRTPRSSFSTGTRPPGSWRPPTCA